MTLVDKNTTNRPSLPLIPEQIVKQFAPLARKLANKYAGKLDSDDLFQIASIAIWEACSTFDPKKGSLNTHLYKSALYAILEQRKNDTGVIRVVYVAPKHRNPVNEIRPIVVSEKNIMENNSTSDSGLLNSAQKIVLQPYLEMLSNNHREVIEMLFLNGMTPKEVSEIRQCTTQNVFHLKQYALKKIKDKMIANNISFEDIFK